MRRMGTTRPLQSLLCTVVAVFLLLAAGASIALAQESPSGAAQSDNDSYVATNREALAAAIEKKLKNGKTKYTIGNYSNDGYEYSFYADSEGFNAGYKGKTSSGAETFSLAYLYESDEVKITTQQIKSSSYFAASAQFVANEYSTMSSVKFQDNTGNNSSCTTEKAFAKRMTNDINKKMVIYLNSSLYKIGFLSFSHSHSGGTATCTSLAICEICDKEYGNLLSHNSVLKNSKNPTCFEEGYTGDYICSKCGALLGKGTSIPCKEYVPATGNKKAIKDYLLTNGAVDSNGDKYIATTTTVEGTEIKNVITYIEDLAQFELFQLSKGDSGTSTVRITLEENGMDTVTAYYTYPDGGLYAMASFDPASFKKSSTAPFEKIRTSSLSNDQIQQLCNEELKSALIGWDLLLYNHLGHKASVQDFGFKSFEIVDRSYSMSNAEVSLSTSKYLYNGSAKKPEISVIIDGKQMVKGVDYSVTYRNNVNAGKASIILTGKGDCKGTKTISFTISKASQTSAKISTKSLTAKGSKANKLTKTKTLSLKSSGVKGNAKITWSKANKTGGSKLKITKSGKVQACKGLKKGTYKIKVKMAIANSANYNSKNVYGYVKVTVK